MNAKNIQQVDLALENPSQNLTATQIKLLQGGLKALGYDIDKINGVADEDLKNTIEQFYDDQEDINFSPRINQAALYVVQQAVIESEEANAATRELASNYNDLNILERMSMQIVLALNGYFTTIDGEHNEQNQLAVTQYLNNETPPSVESMGFVGRAIELAGGGFDETQRRDLTRGTFDALRVESDYRPDAESLANNYIKENADHLPIEQQNLLRDSIKDFEAIEISQADIDQYKSLQVSDMVAKPWQ